MPLVKPRMRDPLAGRTVVVTGASSGIGRALCLRLAARGMGIVAAARSADALRELAREAGAAVHVVQTDVTREESVAELRESARRACGRVDVVVNNAGVGYVEPFASSPVAHWHETLATNLIGALSITRAFLPLLLESGGGLVVNVGSASAAGWPHVALYAASKAALHAASIAIDRELRGSGVRVLSVDIGPTAGTGFGSRSDPTEVAAAIRSWTELGIASTEDLSTADGSAQRIVDVIEAALGPARIRR
jgi:NAD(P)-dependent dehydrogenase (short-subunit alcohol dehydrogenase family)